MMLKMKMTKTVALFLAAVLMPSASIAIEDCGTSVTECELRQEIQDLRQQNKTLQGQMEKIQAAMSLMQQKIAAITVSRDGNVGIGTTTPKKALQVGTNDGIIQAGNSFGAQLSGDPSGNAVFGTNLYVDSNGYLKTAGNHYKYYGYAGVVARWGQLKFYAESENTVADATVTPTPKMIVLNSGNVGIGTTSPKAKLEVISLANNIPSIGNSNLYLRGSNQGYGLAVGTRMAYPGGVWLHGK
jgi:hypothetical protein